MNRLEAPWTDEQVKALNAYQTIGIFHPFTCARRSEHGRFFVGATKALFEHDFGKMTPEEFACSEGVLRATPSGWVCDYCDYTQNWCWDIMAESRWLDEAVVDSLRFPGVS